MKNIKEIDEAIKAGKSFKDIGVCGQFWKAYKESIKMNRNFINFGDTIWDNEEKEILADLKKYNIDTFTFSSTGSLSMPTIGAFVDCGCKVVGAEKIESGMTYYDDNENEIKEMKIAIKMMVA